MSNTLHTHITHYCMCTIWVTQIWNSLAHLTTGWQRPIRCRLFFAKEPPIIRLFCGKWSINIRHPVGLRHAVVAAYHNELHTPNSHALHTYTSHGLIQTMHLTHCILIWVTHIRVTHCTLIWVTNWCKPHTSHNAYSYESHTYESRTAHLYESRTDINHAPHTMHTHMSHTHTSHALHT